MGQSTLLSVWEFERGLARRLNAWSALSGIAGAVLLTSRRPDRRGFGLQALGWGLGCAAIAWGTGRRADCLEARDRRVPADEQRLAYQEAAAIPFVLFVSGLLDLVYLLIGVTLARSASGSPLWRGQGWGIAVQGAFLTAFDLGHAGASMAVELPHAQRAARRAAPTP